MPIDQPYRKLPPTARHLTDDEVVVDEWVSADDVVFVRIEAIGELLTMGDACALYAALGRYLVRPRLRAAGLARLP